jgi:hypothetical protein
LRKKEGKKTKGLYCVLKKIYQNAVIPQEKKKNIIPVYLNTVKTKFTKK